MLTERGEMLTELFLLQHHQRSLMNQGACVMN